MFTYGIRKGYPCKGLSQVGCDSYIELFVNDVLQLTSPTVKNLFIYDADITYTTFKIPKESRIEIKVKDKMTIGPLDDNLILYTKGYVDDFLKEQYRGDVFIKEKQNAIHTVSFWQDELK